MAIVFIAAPVLMKPTAEFVKRDMQLCFIYFFMMSNMGILTNYTQLIQKEIDISLEQSLYLDLLIAAGGVFFYIYWSKIPEGVDRSRLIMKKMRRGYASVLLMMGMIFLSFVTGGDGWKELPDTLSASMVKSFAIPLVDEIKNSTSTWIYFMGKSSICVLVILILAALLTGRIIENYSHDKPLSGSFLIILLMIFIETFFLVPCSNILPIYLLVLVMTVFYKEDKKPMIVREENHKMEIANK